MAIIHIIFFRVPSSITPAEEKALCDGVLSLKSACRLPSGESYILSITGGRDRSNAKFPYQKGFTHAFVFKFKSVADRDYYMEADRTHMEFLKAGEKWIKDEDVAVMDFEEELSY